MAPPPKAVADFELYTQCPGRIKAIMNIFLLSPCSTVSCRELATLDPVRARKQLLECCQLLATVDLLMHGTTRMLRADGFPYKLAHQHHPIVRNMVHSFHNWLLCYYIANDLGKIYPHHACAKSLYRWRGDGRVYTPCEDGEICVCRKGQPVEYVQTLDEYSKLMRPYFMSKIGVIK